MRCAEGIVFALGSLGEAREATALAQCADAIAPPRQNLMRVGLMADIPNDNVARRVEYVVQRNGEFDHTEARSEVPTRDAHSINGLSAEFIGQLPKLGFFQVPEIVRHAHLIEERRRYGHGQSNR